MSGHIDKIVTDLEQVTRSNQAEFSRLSNAQLNWKPAAESWSIAQCLDHLITINRLYFPLFESLKTGLATPTVWERYSPLSGFLGKTLIKSLSPDQPKKTKTRPKAEPSVSVLRWVTYSLDDCLTIFAVHEKRHFLQAKRVMGADGFPRCQEDRG